MQNSYTGESSVIHHILCLGRLMWNVIEDWYKFDDVPLAWKRSSSWSSSIFFEFMGWPSGYICGSGTSTFGVVFLLPLSSESLDHSSDFSDSSDCTCVAEHMKPQTPLLYTWNTNPDQTCAGHYVHSYVWVFCKWVQNQVSIKWYTTSYIILFCSSFSGCDWGD